MTIRLSSLNPANSAAATLFWVILLSAIADTIQLGDFSPQTIIINVVSAVIAWFILMGLVFLKAYYNYKRSLS